MLFRSGGGGGSSRWERSKERNGSEKEASRVLHSPRHRKLSLTSSVGSEYYRKSDLPSQSQTLSRRSDGSNQDSFASRRSEGWKKKSDLSRRSDSGRHEVGARSSKKEDVRAARISEGDKQFPSNTSRNGQGSSDGSDKKALPANLLDIFSQIAQFEKEKGGKPKK